jgi:hypothetical protein
LVSLDLLSEGFDSDFDSDDFDSAGFASEDFAVSAGLASLEEREEAPP